MTIIAFEGIDHSGKSTQIRLLQESLATQGKKSVVIRFPSRETVTGQLLDAMLKGSITISSDEAVHLLFSANRWEKLSEIMDHQNSGIVVILDRYKASGCAYSLAKGLPFKWCIGADSGLPDPDLTILLELKSSLALSRDGYGDEIYDVTSFQELVACSYTRLISHQGWYVVNATKPPLQIHDEILNELHERNIFK